MKSNKQNSHLRQHLIASAIACSCGIATATSAFAQDPEAEQVVTLEQFIAVLTADYRRCAADVLEGDGAVAQMRGDVDSNCRAQREKLFADVDLPSDYKAVYRINLQRRIDALIDAAARAEGIVAATQHDAAIDAGAIASKD